ncbi:MAG: AMP-binding protein [Panacagrimonas sp.]
MTERFPRTAAEAFQRIAEPGRASQAWLVTESRTIGFGELAAHIGQMAALAHSKGLKPGDRVAIASRDDAEIALLFVALVCNGLTVVNLDADTGPERALNLIRVAAPRLMLVDTALVAHWRLAQIDADLLEIAPAAPARPLDRLLGRAKPRAGLHGLLATLAPMAPPAALDPETLAYILFTSGTTAQPKGVSISHRALFAHLRTLARRYDYTPDSRILNTLMLSHTDGITQGPMMGFFAGIGVWRPLSFEVTRIEALLDAVYRLRITHMVAVPTMLGLILRLGLDRRDAFSGGDFRLLISCGAQLEAALWEAFEDAFRVPIVNVYGLTETVTGGVFSGPDPRSRMPGSIGMPEDCELKITRADGSEVSPGEPGELLMRGDLLMSGYFAHPELTEAVLRDGWFHTGDVARCDEHGRYWILGRIKNLIIRGGYNIHPEEVTEVLQTCPGVREAVTLGVADPVWGETVGALVVANPGITAADLMAHCKAQLEPRKLPTHLRLVESLPRGRSGKVLQDEARRLLDDPTADPAPQAATLAASGADEISARLLRVAAKIFKTVPERLALHAAPKDVPGWDSLAHMELVLAIEAEFGIRLSPREIMSMDRLDKALDRVRRG